MHSFSPGVVAPVVSTVLEACSGGGGVCMRVHVCVLTVTPPQQSFLWHLSSAQPSTGCAVRGALADGSHSSHSLGVETQSQPVDAVMFSMVCGTACPSQKFQLHRVCRSSPFWDWPFLIPLFFRLNLVYIPASKHLFLGSSALSQLVRGWSRLTWQMTAYRPNLTPSLLL
jgi:hypothetical protein